MSSRRPPSLADALERADALRAEVGALASAWREALARRRGAESRLARDASAGLAAEDAEAEAHVAGLVRDLSRTLEAALADRDRAAAAALEAEAATRDARAREAAARGILGALSRGLRDAAGAP